MHWWVRTFGIFSKWKQFFLGGGASLILIVCLLGLIQSDVRAASCGEWGRIIFSGSQLEEDNHNTWLDEWRRTRTSTNTRTRTIHGWRDLDHRVKWSSLMFIRTRLWCKELLFKFTKYGALQTKLKNSVLHNVVDFQNSTMTECPEPDYSDGNVSLDYYFPPEKNISITCPLPAPGQLEILIKIRCKRLANNQRWSVRFSFQNRGSIFPIYKCYKLRWQIQTQMKRQNQKQKQKQIQIIPSIIIEGVLQAFVAVLGIVGNITCVVILSRYDRIKILL